MKEPAPTPARTIPAQKEKVLNGKREKEELISEIFSMRPIIRNYVKAKLGQDFPTRIDEVTDEILGKAILGIDGFKEKPSSTFSSLISWVKEIQKNFVISFALNEKNRPLNNLDNKVNKISKVDNIPNPRASILENIDSGLSIEQDFLIKERKEVILKLISKLELQFRVPLLLYYYKEYSLEKIAPILNISIGGVKIRLSRAREALAKLLKREGIKSVEF